MLVSNRTQWICRSCRNELLPLWRNEQIELSLRSQTRRSRAFLESRIFAEPFRSSKYVRSLHTTAGRYIRGSTSAYNHQAHGQSQEEISLAAEEKDDVDSTYLGENSVEEVASSDDPVPSKTQQARRNQVDAAGVARQAREEHGEYLPPGTLTEDELARYVRLYGEPAENFEDLDDGAFNANVKAQGDQGTEPKSRLYQQNPDGSLEAVELDLDEEHEGLDREFDPEEIELEEDEDAGSLQARAAEIAEQVGGEVYHDEDGNIVDDTGHQSNRIHPLTAEGKFSAQTRTIFLPQATLVDPVSKILSGYSNKHISDTALKLFGGPGLPSGVATPISRRGDMQVPIGLTVTQHSMGEMEANAFIAALWPGIYASVMSVLVEVRKRLGTNWLKKLLAKDGGPRILDAGAGGAGIIAWREIVKAEWQALYPDEPVENAPLGKATVLTGADSLRHRSAALLENTTFIPRLPDYVHVRDTSTLDDDREAPQRKQFDVVLAPHTLWNLKEEFLRKQQVQNLWALLSSEGGVLILLEKGVPRGFEVVAAAREQILDRFISSPISETHQDDLQSDQNEDFIVTPKVPGMIIAPCTNHQQCPLYTTPGHSAGRRDLCTFEQRYVRPQTLQRILKAKHRNHEDLRFSYLAVLKGHDHRIPSLSNPNPLVQGASATKAAFTGHDHSPTPESFNTLALPRLIYSGIKRRGHVTLDVCTPEGRAERWTVPKSFSKQAYHDARKSSWGDLWALGAKSRVPRNVRLGKKKGTWTKEDRLAARQEAREARKEDEQLERSLAQDPDDLSTVHAVARELDNQIFDDDGEENLEEDEIEEAILLSSEDKDLEQQVQQQQQQQQKNETHDNDDDDDENAIFDPENWKAWQAEYENDRNKDSRNKGSRGPRRGIRLRSPTTTTTANGGARPGKGKMRKRIGVGY